METGIDIQAVENFVRLAKSAHSKQEYITRVKQFDQRFIEAYPAPIITHPPSIPKSTSNSQRQNTKQSFYEPPKNPFVNSQEEKYRQNNQNSRVNPYQHTGYKTSNTNMPMPPMPHSRSQNNFYKPDDSYIREAQSNLVNHFTGGGYSGGGYHGVHNNGAYKNGNYPGASNNNSYNNNNNGGYSGNDLMYGHLNEQVGMYRNPNMGDRSLQMGGSQSKYMGTQQLSNQYLPNLQEQPEYVKYYKKVVPVNTATGPQSAHKVFTPTQRTNPFKS